MNTAEPTINHSQKLYLHEGQQNLLHSEEITSLLTYEMSRLLVSIITLWTRLRLRII